jgi:hypothetical protein
MNDNDILDRVTASVSGLHMDTPVDSIVARGHARRRRRMSGTAAVGVVAATGLALGLVTVDGGHHTPAASSAGVQLAAFTVVSNADGTATLTLIKGIALDPNALRKKLAAAGVPAVVNLGRACDSHPQPTGLDQVVSPQRRSDGSVVLMITPSAMPAGAELSIGIFPTVRTWSLATIGAPLTCDSTPPRGQSGGPIPSSAAQGPAAG